MSSGSSGWRSATRVLVISVCIGLSAVGVLGAGLLSGPHGSRVSYAPPIAEVVPVPQSQGALKVSQDGVPRLPLTQGAVQQFVLPPDFDSASGEFAYAQYPQDTGSLERFLVSALPKDGWTVSSTHPLTPHGVVLVVVSPQGLPGEVRIEPLPRGIPGLQSQATVNLARRR